jgi:hypothetical protein
LQIGVQVRFFARNLNLRLFGKKFKVNYPEAGACVGQREHSRSRMKLKFEMQTNQLNENAKI